MVPVAVIGGGNRYSLALMRVIFWPIRNGGHCSKLESWLVANPGWWPILAGGQSWLVANLVSWAIRAYPANTGLWAALSIGLSRLMGSLPIGLP